jgi:hypothetical protein
LKAGTFSGWFFRAGAGQEIWSDGQQKEGESEEGAVDHRLYRTW